MSWDLQDSIPDDAECMQCGRHDIQDVAMCSCGRKDCGTTVCRPKFGCRGSVPCEQCDNIMLPGHAELIDGYPVCSDCAPETRRYSEQEKRRERRHRKTAA